MFVRADFVAGVRTQLSQLLDSIQNQVYCL
jgi:hypothetical protein